MKEKETKQILKKYIFNGTKSIALFDQFGGIGKKNEFKYNYLEIMNSYQGVSKDGHVFSYRLVIKHGAHYPSVGYITFTELKQKKDSDLKQYINETITKAIIDKYKNTDKMYEFKKPFRLMAQTTLNRMGYGYSGTLYGETTDYLICGIYII